jgi:RNA polymerase sigma factor (TIGR02999 family)
MSDEGEGGRTETEKLLRDVEAGTDGAGEALFQLVHTELRRRAEALMRRQPRGHTLQATALVGEAYLRLFSGAPVHWNDHKHFLLAASRAMRHTLVDHARAKARLKRAGDRIDSPLDDLVVEYEDRALDIEALQRALARLETMDPDMARAVELRFFCGSSVEETARILGMAERTFERRWQMTRAWLFGEVR